MPRPDKPINPGPLGGPTSSSRSHTWSKHGETGASGYRGRTEIEVEVEDLVITTDDAPDPADELSKFERRGTAAHAAYESDMVQGPVFEKVPEWTVERSVDGRTYRRTDTMELVEQLKPVPDPEKTRLA